MARPSPIDGGAPGSDRQRHLEELYRRYNRPLRSFFFRRIGRWEEAQDLVHDLFARLAGRPDLETILSPDAFLFASADNLLRDRARMNHRQSSENHVGTEDLGSGGSLPAELIERIEPERVLQSKERVKALVHALDELDAQVRRIFVLHKVEKLKQREIAEVVGISLSSVEKSLAKAMAHVARRIGEI